MIRAEKINKASQVVSKTSKITVSQTDSCDIIGNNKKSFCFPKFNLDMDVKNHFARVFVRGSNDLNSAALKVLLADIKGKWIVPDVLPLFIAAITRNILCDTWIPLFKLSLSAIEQGTISKGVFEEFEFVSNKHDVGQLVALIGWYCGTSVMWNAFVETMELLQIPVYEMIEPVKYCIDFTTEALQVDKCRIGRSLEAHYLSFFSTELEILFHGHILFPARPEEYDFTTMKKYMF